MCDADLFDLKEVVIPAFWEAEVFKVKNRGYCSNLPSAKLS
jgi:hypothetical protein